MDSEDLNTLIAQGESETLEFKEARKGLNKDVFESICAFLNRQGGHVVLGVKDNDTVRFENASRPVQFGPIDPQHFTPHPKNPTILRFFREMKWSEELGSGLKNTFHYVPLYTPGRQASFRDGSLFVTEIPIPPFTNLVSGPDQVLSDPLKGLNDPVNEISAPLKDLNDPPNLKPWLQKIMTTPQKSKASRTDWLEHLEALILAIAKQEGENSVFYAHQLSLPLASVRRYLQQLKAIEIIAFQGASRNGGYHLCPITKEEINHAQKRH